MYFLFGSLPLATRAPRQVNDRERVCVGVRAREQVRGQIATKFLHLSIIFLWVRLPAAEFNNTTRLMYPARRWRRWRRRHLDRYTDRVHEAKLRSLIQSCSPLCPIAKLVSVVATAAAVSAPLSRVASLASARRVVRTV